MFSIKVQRNLTSYILYVKIISTQSILEPKAENADFNLALDLNRI